MSDKLSIVEQYKQEFAVPDSSDALTARKETATAIRFAIALSATSFLVIANTFQGLRQDPMSGSNLDRSFNSLTNLVFLLLGFVLAYVAVCFWGSFIGWRLLHDEAVARQEWAPAKAQPKSEDN